MTGIIVYYLFMLGLLLFISYHREYKRHYIVVKTATSVGFIVIAIAGLMSPERGIYRSHSIYFISLLPGLCSCFAGDVFLAIRKRTKKMKWFVWGIVTFALAHILFISLLTKYASYPWWTYLIPIFSMILAYKLFGLPMVDAGNAKWACIIYSYIVTLFVVRAFGVMIAWEFSKAGLLLAVGAVLFYISDVTLIFLYFSKEKIKWMHAANLIAYYIGIGLVATSIYFM